MIYANAYKTTLMRKNQYQKELNHYIEEYIVRSYWGVADKSPITEISTNNGLIKPVILMNLSDDENNVPVFNHAIYDENNKWGAMDLRHITNKDSISGRVNVKNIFEFDLSLNRYILSTLWHLGAFNKLYNLAFAHELFASWLSNVIVQKFSLMPQDKLRLQALGYLYYTALFTNSLNDDDALKSSIRFKSSSHINDEIINEIYYKIGDGLNNIDDFCSSCYTATDNIRLKGFNSSILVSIIQNNWLSINGREILLAGLEHPPSWLSIAYCASNVKNFNRSYISSLAENVGKKGKVQEFTMDFLNLVSPYKNNDIIKNYIR